MAGMYSHGVQYNFHVLQTFNEITDLCTESVGVSRYELCERLNAITDKIGTIQCPRCTILQRQSFWISKFNQVCQTLTTDYITN